MNDFEKKKQNKQNKTKNTISRYSCQNVNGGRSKVLSLSMQEIVWEKGNLGIHLEARLCVLSILVIRSIDVGAQIGVFIAEKRSVRMYLTV